jgi:hypothetical protein
MSKKEDTRINAGAQPAEGAEARSGQANKPAGRQRGQRRINNPADVATLALAHMNEVSKKKDELTMAVRGLSDLCQQLAKVYFENGKTIAELKRRIQTLEEKK